MLIASQKKINVQDVMILGMGNQIRKARKARHLSQLQLAKQIGVTASAVTNYENNRSYPKGVVLTKLFSVLQVDANYLFQDSVSFPVNNINTLLLSSDLLEVIEAYEKADKETKRFARRALGIL